MLGTVHACHSESVEARRQPSEFSSLPTTWLQRLVRLSFAADTFTH